MDFKAALGSIVTWAKAHPVMAGGAVVGAVGLGYLGSKSLGKATQGPQLASEGAPEDASGAGAEDLGLEDVAPILPYSELVPSGLLPEYTILDSSQPEDGGGWTDIFDPVIKDIGIKLPAFQPKGWVSAQSLATASHPNLPRSSTNRTIFATPTATPTPAPGGLNVNPPKQKLIPKSTAPKSLSVK